MEKKDYSNVILWPQSAIADRRGSMDWSEWD